MAEVELPKDATGKDITLDTKSCYYKDGHKYFISGFEYEVCTGKWKVLFAGGEYSYPEHVYLDPPDSWRRLLEDLDRVASGGSMCDYTCKDPDGCSKCKFNKAPCAVGVFADIANRIRALRGESK